MSSVLVDYHMVKGVCDTYIHVVVMPDVFFVRHGCVGTRQV